MSYNKRRKHGRKWQNNRRSCSWVNEGRGEEMLDDIGRDNERNYKKKELDGKSRSRNCYQEDGPSTSEGHDSRRHPSGLRGKAIGMWYAARGRARKKKKESIMKAKIAIDSQSEKQIRSLLDTIHQSRTLNTAVDKLTVTDGMINIEDLNEFEREYTTHLEDSCLREGGLRAEYDDTMSNLNPIKELDEKLALENTTKKSNTGFNKMLGFRKKLPVYTMQKDIIDLIESNQVVVISGETGCGKSTQVPQFILDHYIEIGKGSCCSIVCTQPRRISAISLAERVADERNESCGGKSVGYQIRLESKLPNSQGSILYCTTGIILKRLESDEYLSGISHIVMDEVHERDLDTDFLLIVIKDLLKIRKELKVIIMSATLNSKVFSRYFDNCSMFNIPGFTYPVEEFFLEDVLQMTSYSSQFAVPDRHRRSKHRKEKDVEEMKEVFLRNLKGDYPDSVIRTLKAMDEDEIDLDLIVHLIQYICTKKEDGAILIFLPGWDAISNVHKKLKSLQYFRSAGCIIIPLHSMMPTVNQKEVFNRPLPGVRKIILSTNIAETSITIDDVVYVIDTGKSKLSNFDIENNLATLKPEWISKANAHQRRGRAGRVQSGICYHLVTSFRYNLLEDYQLPEMLRTRLEDICLRIKILKLGKIIPFVRKALDSPSIDAVRLSVEFLQTLNALDEEENLTPLGFHLARLPVDPQAGKLILYASIFGCFDPIATVAASLSFKDAFLIPLSQEAAVDRKKWELSAKSNSDHIMLINAMKGWENARRFGNERSYCWDNYLSSNTLQMLSNMRRQFAGLLYDLHFLPSKNTKDHTANSNSDNLHLIRAVLCAGLYPNIAKVMKRAKPSKRFAGPTKIITKDGRVYLHPKSVNCKSTFESPWLVYFVKIKSKQVFLHDTSVVNPFHLLLFGGNLKTEKDDALTVIIIDDWIKFWCPKETAELIMDLRKELDLMLEYKITHPDPTNWSMESTEIALFKAIQNLLEREHIESPYSCRRSESMEIDE